MAQIYLFREHEDFQTGKSKLKKGAVINISNIWIGLLLILALALIGAAGNSLRLQWRFNTTGRAIVGTVTDCEEVTGSKGGTTTYVDYRYVLADVVYEAEDRVGSGRMCGEYPQGIEIVVYYLSDAPEESGVGSFLHGIDWTDSWILAAMGFPIILLVFFLMIKQRKERYKHALLQRHADMLIEATVETVGEVKGKGGYKYADYIFTSPDMGLIHGQLRTGLSYHWPSHIQQQDSLTILYLDSENYCVL